MSDDRDRVGTLAQYEALRKHVALVDDSDRLIVEVTGERARDMIDGLVTNALGPLAQGTCVYAFMLTAKGRVVAEMRVIPKPAAPGGARGAEEWVGDVWLDAPAGCAEPLLSHLAKYLPPLYARFFVTDVTRLSVVGPLASRAVESTADALGWRIETRSPEELGDLRAVLLDPGAAESREAAGTPLLLVRREGVEGPGLDLYAPASLASRARTELLGAVRALDGLPASRAAWDILRVERGVPVYGREITPGNLPQETGQTERAIHFEKGCYTGQEVVARIHYRGHVNRRLVGFQGVDPAEPIAPDSPLFLGERKVAETSTAVTSPRFGAIALGYARREVLPDQLLARVAGGPLDVHLRGIPFTLT